MHGLRARPLPVVRNQRAVELRFVLERARRVTFVLYGPAPACVVAGRLAVAGHRGANTLRFDGYVRHRLLRPGAYRVVPLPAFGSEVLGRSAVSVRVDVHGARPLGRLPRLNCEIAPLLEQPPLSSPPRTAGVEGARVAHAGERGDGGQTSPQLQASVRLEGPPTASGVFGLGDVSESAWPTVALIGSLTWAFLLLGVASVEWGYTAARFRLVRALDGHRAEVGLLGAGFLGLAAMLYLMARLG